MFMPPGNFIASPRSLVRDFNGANILAFIICKCNADPRGRDLATAGLLRPFLRASRRATRDARTRPRLRAERPRAISLRSHEALRHQAARRVATSRQARALPRGVERGAVRRG